MAQNSKAEILQVAQESILLQARSVSALTVNEEFVKAIEAIRNCAGSVVVSGIGKSAIIAQKITATFNSTGTYAKYMHAADAIHGDLGMITANDILLILSKSGSSPEIKAMLPILKSYGNIIIAICGTKGSYLAENAAIFLDTTVEKEACPNNLAPTTSTTAQMVMGDALAVTLLSLNQFNEKDFARVHPGGALGKQLYLTVKDLCQYTLKPQILPQDNLKTIIHSITEGRVGATAVVDNEGALLGIITDGDLRRALSESRLNDAITAADIMTPHPKTVEAERLAADALQAMRANDINQIVVMEYAKYVGMVHLHDILREGIV